MPDDKNHRYQWSAGRGAEDHARPSHGNDGKSAQENPASEISKGLEWLADRGWPLTGILFFISMLYLYQFITQNRVPLSITSPSVITALPVLFGFLAFLIFTLAGFFFSPAMVLFTAVDKEGNVRLVDVLPKNKIDRDARDEASSPWLLWGWPLIPALLGALVVVPVGFPTEWFEKSSLWLWLVWAGCWLVSVFMFVGLALFWTHRSRMKLHAAAPAFWGIAAVAMFFQLFVMSMIVLLLMQHGTDFFRERLILLTLAATAAGWFLGILQLQGARILGLVMEPGKQFIRAGIAAFGLVVLVGMQPLAAAYLTGAVLQLTSSGARSCAVLLWAEEEAPPSMWRLHERGTPAQSAPLRIVTEADGYYIVRIRGQESAAVHFVPRVLVAGMDDCPKRARQGS